jgi:hypothetical protein
MSLTEVIVEEVALGGIEWLGYAVRHGTLLAPRDHIAGIAALRAGVQKGW